MYNVLIAGATGTLGKNLIDYSLNQRQVKVVRALVFHNTHKIKSFNVEKAIADINDEESIAKACSGIDCLFLCMGSNYSKEELTEDEADYLIPLKIAKTAKKNGVKQIVMINNPYANANSRNTYYKNRGKLQQAIIDLKFDSTIIVQAISIRRQKKADMFYRVIGSNLLNVLTIGLWHKNRPINVNYVAKAMIKLALKKEKGVFIYTPHQIRIL